MAKKQITIQLDNDVVECIIKEAKPKKHPKHRPKQVLINERLRKSYGI